MTIHPKTLDRMPTREEAEAAAALLHRWTEAGGEAALVPGLTYPALSRRYPEGFRPDAAYRDSLPDLQNGPAALIVGAPVAIQHVGISNFRLPLRYRLRDGDEVTLETAVTGSVSLEAEKKGINMSRILRSFYAHAGEAFGLDVVERAVDAYKDRLEAFDARIALRFSLPLTVGSLRSGLSGWQYYRAGMEVADRKGLRTRMLHLDFVYSSTCPCSLELSEHARMTRGQMATPHSQRSVARLSVVAGEGLTVEDLIDIARKAVPTETQVMVKREDEQAFAELNAANPIFVEDAARSFAAGLMADARVGDFRVVASHQESLHSHDAVSLLTRGPAFAAEGIEPHLFASLIHPG